MVYKIDLVGERVNMLTVIEETEERKYGSVVWLCKCDCGNYVKAHTQYLRSGKIVSCGCSKSKTWQRKASELVGEKFGRLTVIKPLKERTGKYKIQYLCKCECGNETIVRSDALKDGSTKSCGCLYNERIHQIKGQKFGKLKALKIADYKKKNNTGNIWECVCDCGNHVDVVVNALVKGHTRSCGCLQDEWRKQYSGEKHHFYNSELSDEDRLEKHRYVIHGSNGKKWRAKVYERDNYTCVLCNEKGGDLSAHHLDGWNWAKSKRFDLNNGVTLCKKCHDDFHNKYGRGDNTKEQFEEYTKAGE